MASRHLATALALLSLALGAGLPARAQIDPYARNLLQLGYDQPLAGRGPQAAYAYYYYNNPHFQRTNLALRVAVAPVYFDGELGFREALSPHTDLGLAVSGGGFNDNYYEIRQGHYHRDESFEGYGGGAALKLYHRLNPDQLIPLNYVLSGGFHYSTYDTTSETAPAFELPDERVNLSVRTGLRLAGREPVLYPDLAMELSVWYEHEWRLVEDRYYGFGNDRKVVPSVGTYWLYAGLNYSWTNSGTQFTAALTSGGSHHSDRFSAARLGGVLPLAAEFPLTLPGYYYQEISAARFTHLSVSYLVSLSANHRWQLRLGGTSSHVEYVSGFNQSTHWHTGVGPDLSYTSPNDTWRVILRYGYGINAERNHGSGAHSIGLLCQFNFGPEPNWRHLLRW
ncbi:MAG: hypothetical protein M9920_06020 [Verrucomicrobiae bacterium]|nr:hypothetical protein [Verrucomicrobiae bacterium]